MEEQTCAPWQTGVSQSVREGARETHGEQVCVLSGHTESVVLKWILASGLVGFEVALVMEEQTCAPWHTRVSKSVRECNAL